MKIIKAITDFGIEEVKTVGSKKEIFGELFVVADVPIRYMNSHERMILRKVLHYRTGMNIPVTINKHNPTVKDYFNITESFLSNIPADEIKKEVDKYETINN